MIEAYLNGRKLNGGSKLTSMPLLAACPVHQSRPRQAGEQDKYFKSSLSQLSLPELACGTKEQRTLERLYQHW